MIKRILFFLFLFTLFFIPLDSFSDTGKSILLKIGSRTAYVNFQPVTLDIAPLEIKGRTLVPLRFLAENFGAKKIEYYADTEEILILLDDQSVLRDEIARLKSDNESLRKRIQELENNSPQPPRKLIQLPGQPKNIKGTISGDHVQLTWDPVTPGTYPVAGYRIYKDSLCYKEYVRIATISASQTMYEDPDVIEGKTYIYYITAIDSDIPPNESLESSVKIITVPSSQNPNPPRIPSLSEYKLQYSFPDYRYPYNIKEVYIAEDPNYVYYRYTTYRSWKDETNFDIVTWIDIDQNIFTGLKSDNGAPIGYEYAAGFFYNENGEFVGAIMKVNEKNRLEIFYIYNDADYKFESNSIVFPVSKSLFYPNQPFDYQIMILYDNQAHEPELYPKTSKMSYPKTASGNKAFQQQGYLHSLESQVKKLMNSSSGIIRSFKYR